MKSNFLSISRILFSLSTACLLMVGMNSCQPKVDVGEILVTKTAGNTLSSSDPSYAYINMTYEDHVLRIEEYKVLNQLKQTMLARYIEFGNGVNVPFAAVEGTYAFKNNSNNGDEGYDFNFYPAADGAEVKNFLFLSGDLYTYDMENRWTMALAQAENLKVIAENLPNTTWLKADTAISWKENVLDSMHVKIDSTKTKKGWKYTYDTTYYRHDEIFSKRVRLRQYDFKRLDDAKNRAFCFDSVKIIDAATGLPKQDSLSGTYVDGATWSVSNVITDMKFDLVVDETVINVMKFKKEQGTVVFNGDEYQLVK